MMMRRWTRAEALRAGAAVHVHEVAGRRSGSRIYAVVAGEVGAGSQGAITSRPPPRSGCGQGDVHALAPETQRPHRASLPQTLPGQDPRSAVFRGIPTRFP